MFDLKGDYALNKRDKDAIVYRNPTGEPIRLTRADFTSEEAFQKWKAWSDGDYKKIAQSGRSFYDNCVSLNELLDSIAAMPSAEDVLIYLMDEAEHKKEQAALFRKVKAALTRKQFRRLWMISVDGSTPDEAAVKENVTRQSISFSIVSAKRKIKKFLKIAKKTLRKRPFSCSW